ncbi:MAG: signal peptidase II [Clostridia bacterium]|nr:signal peptidase II [Clostridia bacterium]
MICLFFGVIVAVVALDLTTKFTIDGVLNPGIAWGLGAEFDWLWIVVVIFSFVLVGLLIWWFFYTKHRTWCKTLGLSLFIAGALGNAIDRLLSHGAVHDFINWGIFRNNIADIVLCIGAMLMVVTLIWEDQHATR